MTDRRLQDRHSFPIVRSAAFALGALAPGVLMAHPGDLAAHGFAAGIAHPWFGLDHLIAMVLVGFWAVQLGGRARWMLPLTFVTAMIGGSSIPSLLAMGGAVEGLVALSVLTLGVFVAARARLATGLAVTLVATFALMHGYAHGVEIPASATRLAFTSGFAVSTLALHLGGLALASAALRASAQGWLRAAGASAALVGATMLIS